MLVKVGLAQIDCAVGGVEENCARIAEFCRSAAGAGCDAVIFPEMADTAYVPEVISGSASSWDGLPYQTLQRCALEQGLFVVCGLSEREADRIYNAQAVFAPDGSLLGRYRKTHLFTPDPIHEERIFSPGDDLTLLPIGNLFWGFSICYDLRFPELYRLLALRGADVFVNSTAWPMRREKHWDLLSRARAVENQAYFIGVNRVGSDNEFRFGGRSRIIDPLGEPVAEASGDREELLVGDIDIEKIRRVRVKMPIFSSRRGDIYGNFGAG
jgi:predicted amidohydrolase